MSVRIVHSADCTEQVVISIFLRGQPPAFLLNTVNQSLLHRDTMYIYIVSQTARGTSIPLCAFSNSADANRYRSIKKDEDSGGLYTVHSVPLNVFGSE